MAGPLLEALLLLPLRALDLVRPPVKRENQDIDHQAQEDDGQAVIARQFIALDKYKLKEEIQGHDDQSV